MDADDQSLLAQSGEEFNIDCNIPQRLSLVGLSVAMCLWKIYKIKVVDNDLPLVNVMLYFFDNNKLI